MYMKTLWAQYQSIQMNFVMTSASSIDSIVNKLCLTFSHLHENHKGMYVTETLAYNESFYELNSAVSKILHGKNGKVPFSTNGVYFSNRGLYREVMVSGFYKQISDVQRASWKKNLLVVMVREAADLLLGQVEPFWVLEAACWALREYNLQLYLSVEVEQWLIESAYCNACVDWNWLIKMERGWFLFF